MDPHGWHQKVSDPHAWSPNNMVVLQTDDVTEDTLPNCEPPTESRQLQQSGLHHMIDTT